MNPQPETTQNIIKAGESFIATVGEYDDYTVLALMVAKTDFNLMDARTEFAGKPYTTEELRLDIRRSKTQHPKDFLEWLEQKGLVTRVLYKELNMGPYDVLSGYGIVPRSWSK